MADSHGCQPWLAAMGTHENGSQWRAKVKLKLNAIRKLVGCWQWLGEKHKAKHHSGLNPRKGLDIKGGFELRGPGLDWTA